MKSFKRVILRRMGSRRGDRRGRSLSPEWAPASIYPFFKKSTGLTRVKSELRFRKAVIFRET